MPCVTELLETGDVHPDGEALMGVWSFSPREVAENGAAAGRQECQDVIDLFDMFDMFRAAFSSRGLDEAWTHARDSTRTTSSPMREGSRRGPRGIAPVRGMSFLRSDGAGRLFFPAHRRGWHEEDGVCAPPSRLRRPVALLARPLLAVPLALQCIGMDPLA